MHEITPQVTIASLNDIETESIDSDVCISVCQERADDNVSVPYEQFPLSDGPHSQYLGGECSYWLFSEAADCVADIIDAGDSVCVHCHRGQSRSVAVVMAAFTTGHGWDYETAREAVYQAHPDPSPSPTLEAFATTYAASNGASLFASPFSE